MFLQRISSNHQSIQKRYIIICIVWFSLHTKYWSLCISKGMNLPRFIHINVINSKVTYFSLTLLRLNRWTNLYELSPVKERPTRSWFCIYLVSLLVSRTLGYILNKDVCYFMSWWRLNDVSLNHRQKVVAYIPFPR